MYRKSTIIIFINAFFSIVAGYLLSAISLVGRVGIGLFYQQYRFLKIWWKGALLVFVVWLFVWIFQLLLRKKMTVAGANVLHGIFLTLGIVGMYFSYNDFRHTLSHRWLGERFHLGVYLFWTGWLSLTIYVRMQSKVVVNIENSLHQ